MAIDANTGMITWTPGASQVGTAASDRPGHRSGRQHGRSSIPSTSWQATPRRFSPPRRPRWEPPMKITAMTIALTAFINNGTGTTTSPTRTPNAVMGGIALTGTTGNGTWAYSLDGTTFTNVGTVAESSALLLPNNAVLRYTPTSATAEPPRSPITHGTPPAAPARARSICLQPAPPAAPPPTAPPPTPPRSP